MVVVPFIIVLQELKSDSLWSIDETSRVELTRTEKWPSEKEQADELAREHCSFKEELGMEGGLLLKFDRIVIPLKAEGSGETHGAHIEGGKMTMSFVPCGLH